MTLKDLLNSPEPGDARRQKTDFTSEVRFSVSGEATEADVSRVGVPEGEDAFRDAIKTATGFDIPPHRQVLLDRVSVWGRDPQTDEPYVACKFKIVDRTSAAVSAVDGVQILKELRSGKRTTPRRVDTGDTGALVTSWADWQVGLIEGGGTPAFLERLDLSYDNLAARAKELRKIGRSLGELVVIGGGDMIENCAMRPNQAYELDLDRRGQIKVATAGILDGLDRLAPLFSRVRVLAVPGNHGEHRIDGKKTSRGDNDDLAVFEHAALAASRDKRLSHVEFYISQESMSKTLDVQGWVLGTTHGHVFPSGAGGIEAKFWKWFQAQAAGRFPAGDSHVFVSHHYHHLSVREFGGVTWVQAPAMDGGSAWFTDSSGQYSAPGMLTFRMSPDNRMHDLQIV